MAVILLKMIVIGFASSAQYSTTTLGEKVSIFDDEMFMV